MMYRHQTEKRRQPVRRRRRTSRWLWMLLMVPLSVVLIAYGRHGAVQSDEAPMVPPVEDEVAVDEQYVPESDRIVRRRLLRNQIPPFSLNGRTYRQLFDDSNYVHLSAARAIGIDPDQVGDPAENSRLVPIFSTQLYRVDTMWHAKPYLLPEATLLLRYIALRFNELSDECYPGREHYKVIVTSALRTEDSERRLRRVNRNATDTSCHMFGTTFDLSAQRYEHPDGYDTVVDWCKELLARTLYELRYEGLCYVKYERGSCFHITLRTTQYEGPLAAEQMAYVNPGSPRYLQTKAPPRPRYRTPEKPADMHSSVLRQESRQAGTTTAPKHKHHGHKHEGHAAAEPDKAPSVTLHNQPLSDRERMSLEQYERSY